MTCEKTSPISTQSRLLIFDECQSSKLIIFDSAVCSLAFRHRLQHLLCDFQVIIFVAHLNRIGW